MKGGKGGRKRRPAGGSAKGKPSERSAGPKKGTKGPWADAPKRGDRHKPFGGRSSAAED
jgi:hypothetical protein